MNTILNNLKSCCYRWNIPFPASGTIYNNSDPSARQLLHILYAVAEDLRESGSWTQQKRIHTFTTEVDRTKYPLPQDFYRDSPFTHWNTDETRRLVGVLPDFDFTARLYGGFGTSDNFEYRFFGPDSNPNTIGGQFNVYPEPTEEVDCTFEYISSNLFMPKNWLPSTAYTSGTYVNASGNIYLCDTNGTSHASTPPSGTTADITDGTTRWDYVSSPYETILADTDFCIFDDEIVKLGVRAFWLDEKGEEGERAMSLYRSKKTRAIGRLKGAKIGSFSREDRSDARYTTPRTFI